MKPFYEDTAALIYNGDSKDMADIPDQSIQCVVTSPPYWGLRDYGVEGQLGLEPTPEEYVANLVEVFREVWRVLRDDGTVWLNLGDSYASGKGTCFNPGGGNNNLNLPAKDAGAYPLDRGNKSVLAMSGLKPKDLVGIPWRVAFALQAEGWYLRQDIIWSKPNPMPESVKDRPTRAHEYVFLLSKSQRYYYDTDAIAELSICFDTDKRAITGHTGGRKTISGQYKIDKSGAYNKNGHRNKRSVWEIPTCPYPEAHFAVFPEALVEPCILAGSKTGDTVLDPFAGSGTTLWVAKRLGRKAIGYELNQEYCELAVKRIPQMAMEL